MECKDGTGCSHARIWSSASPDRDTRLWLAQAFSGYRAHKVDKDAEVELLSLMWVLHYQRKCAPTDTKPLGLVGRDGSSQGRC